MPAVLKSVHSGPASMVICMSNIASKSTSDSESQDEDSMRMCPSNSPDVDSMHCGEQKVALSGLGRKWHENRR